MELNEFLVKAKIGIYASGGEGGEKKFPDGSRELYFSEEDFEYRDRYFGFDYFIGEEIVLQNKKPVWVMNYCGGMTS